MQGKGNGKKTDQHHVGGIYSWEPVRGTAKISGVEEGSNGQTADQILVETERCRTSRETGETTHLHICKDVENRSSQLSIADHATSQLETTTNASILCPRGIADMEGDRQPRTRTLQLSFHNFRSSSQAARSLLCKSLNTLLTRALKDISCSAGGKTYRGQVSQSVTGNGSPPQSSFPRTLDPRVIRMHQPFTVHLWNDRRAPARESRPNFLQAARQSKHSWHSIHRRISKIPHSIMIFHSTLT